MILLINTIEIGREVELTEESPTGPGPGMKYCSNCGRQIDYRAEICPYCGVRVAPPPIPYGPPKMKSEGLAAVLSFFIPGLGQIYNGQIGKGLLIIVLDIVLAFFIWFFCLTLIALFVIWIWSIFDAYNTAKQINQRYRI